LAIEK